MSIRIRSRTSLIHGLRSSATVLGLLLTLSVALAAQQPGAPIGRGGGAGRAGGPPAGRGGAMMTPVGTPGLNREWTTYGGDLANTRYSPLEQINAGNFDRLQIAWRFKTENLGPDPEFNFQSTPLMVDGVVYTTAGTRRAAVAIDAASGELLWMHRIDEGERAEEAPRRLSGRGLAYWTDPTGGARIFYVTPGYQLIALDAKTGARITSFGTNGIVDLKLGLDQDNLDLVTADIGLHTAPIVARGVIVIGAAHTEGSGPPTPSNVKGYVRGFDARTGARKWIFHTIPQAGEFANDTWLNDSWRFTGNTGVWTQISIDEELGLVYLPVEMPTGDYYGGHRPGNNLFGSSLVAVELETGRRRWHQQTVHHDIWDSDLPSAPVLVNINVDGRAVRAVALPTKQNLLFVYDRATGEPVWPIEERPVPKGDVPGEWYSPTQPFPTKPAAFGPNGLRIEDLIDFTPELRAEAERIVSLYRIGPLYTPPSVSVSGGPYGTLYIPNSTGGPNWPGGSFDPETGIFYIYTKTQVSAFGLVNNPNRSTMDWVMGRAPAPAGQQAPPAGLTVQGLPLIKPPWAHIAAIDLNRGEVLWKIPHGDTPENVKNNPALQGIEIPRTGRIGRIGTLSTKSLLIAGEAGFTTLPSGERGALLRAYDKMTGADAGAVEMPAPQTGSPMTYMLDGIQYVVVAVAGGGFPGELIAYRLPANAIGAP
jgi:quinoprotein glucose dehydrogenase